MNAQSQLAFLGINAGVQYADGMNLYQYLKSNPLIGRDPSGLYDSSDPFAFVDEIMFDYLIEKAYVANVVLESAKNMAKGAAQLMKQMLRDQIIAQYIPGGSYGLSLYYQYQTYKTIRDSGFSLTAAIDAVFGVVHLGKGLYNSINAIRAGNVQRKIRSLFSRYNGGRRITSSRTIPASLNKGPKNTHVYLAYEGGQVSAVYAGISKNVAKRAKQHGLRFSEVKQITTQPLTRRQARAIEQAFIENNSHAFQNRINSISPTRDWYQEAVEWGEAWMHDNGFASYLCE